MSTVVRKAPVATISVPYESSYWGRLLRGRTNVLRHARSFVEAKVPVLSSKDMHGVVEVAWKGVANQSERKQVHAHFVLDGRLLMPTRYGLRANITRDPYRILKVGQKAENLLRAIPSDGSLCISTPFFRIPNIEDSYDRHSKTRNDAIVSGREAFAEIVADDEEERRAEALRLAADMAIVDGVVLSSSHEFVLREWRDHRHERPRISSTVEPVDVLARPSSVAHRYHRMHALNSPDAPPAASGYGGVTMLQGDLGLLETRIDFAAIEACRRLRILVGLFVPESSAHAFHGSGSLAVPDVPEDVDDMLRSAAAAVAAHDDPATTAWERNAIVEKTLVAFDRALASVGLLGSREDMLDSRRAAAATAERWAAELGGIRPTWEPEDEDALYLGM